MALLPTPEEQFLEHLPAIDRIAGLLARRRGLTGADQEDFVAHVRARFVESGYLPFARYRGESSMATYLSVVIASWVQDYVIARDGRWRPSAAASRAGPVAVLLERLMHKSGCTRQEAVTRVLAGGDQPYSESELQRLAASLPTRTPLRPTMVADTAAESVAAASVDADGPLTAEEHEVALGHAQRILDDAMRSLAAEDRLMVGMRFLDGHSVADIARAMRVDQKPLYRRLERTLASLRRTLESAGLNRDGVQDLISGGSP
jgi:RNA polymerase sigma factor (sigma-70 family)